MTKKISKVKTATFDEFFASIKRGGKRRISKREAQALSSVILASTAINFVMRLYGKRIYCKKD
jgi:hypothetical protein